MWLGLIKKRNRSGATSEGIGRVAPIILRKELVGWLQLFGSNYLGATSEGIGRVAPIINSGDFWLGRLKWTDEFFSARIVSNSKSVVCIWPQLKIWILEFFEKILNGFHPQDAWVKDLKRTID